MNLDAIAKNLLNLYEIRLLSAKEIDAYESAMVHWRADGGAVFLGSNFIARDLEILLRFGRLDFDLPVRRA